ncbi:MAG: type II secretion system F family protein [Candidatus Margulisiibacteriota bacterium]|jgi:type II secretory pathway component PulF
MPTFKYTARTPDGKVTTSTIEAPDAARVADLIQNYGFMPLQIVEYKQTTLNKELNLTFDFISPKDILVMTRQLSTLLGAGLTLINSLDSIAEQSTNKKVKDMVTKLKDQVSGGSRFSEALKDFPKYFSTVYINMIAVGERAGIIVEILKRLVSLIEYEESIKNQIKKATRYPLMVVVTLCVASLVLVVFVLPNFMGMFNMLGSNLPLPTRILIGVNKFVMKYWLLVAAVIGGALFMLKRYISTDAGRYKWDKFQLKVPVIGPVINRLIISRFARILAMLNQSGLPILEAVDVVAKTTDNRVVARGLAEIKEKIRGGQGISKPMMESKLFPLTVSSMVAIGEQSGNLSEMLFKVADYYDEEVNLALDNLASLIEPILIAFLAVIVLFVALAVFLPMWSMMSLIK